ncbi:MAG: lysophospholipase [Candidatus Margulisiibacteriota bacterium]
MPELMGQDFLYRKWTINNPRAVLLLIHGIGAHSARWNFFADYFCQKGFASYALELPGFGQTPNHPRGHVDSFNLYYQDIQNLLGMIKRDYPDRKVFIVGESMGGLIAFLAASKYKDQFAGQILLSPAFQNGMKFPFSAYLTLIANALINPKKSIKLPFTSAMVTRDVAYQKVMDNNPDELRYASVKILLNILFAQIKAKRIAKKTTTPSLFLLSLQDQLVNAKASQKMFSRLTIKDKSLIEYPAMLHALYIDLDREKVFANILNWLEKRI